MLSNFYFIFYILAIASVIVMIVAQVKVENAFSKNNKIICKTKITGAQFARDILAAAKLSDIDVIKVSGTMSDYYHHSKKVLALSSSYSSTSVAALGIAAHEVGHALQYKEGYGLIKVRNFLIPITNFTARFFPLIIIVGLVISIFLGFGVYSDIMIMGGISFYFLSFLVNLVTLPVEYDASRRAKELLLETGAVDSEEIKGVSEVLNAAALTYVASALTSLVYLLRFLLVFAKHRDD